MRKQASILFILVMLFAMVAPAPAAAASPSLVIPTFSIVSVARDQSVTIRTSNFPARDNFRVLMNFIGTRGVNGWQVATINSGAGGSFNATFNIPSQLQGQRQIAIRLQSTTGSGYFAYNWFYNNPSGTNTGGGGIPPSPGTSGIPTFRIASVVADKSVTIRTNNFPANDSFNVLMNFMGTRGVRGIRVATIASGAGGSFNATFDIPADLKGQRQIAIRLQSNTGSGFFAYNWFWNNTTGSGTGGEGIPPSPGYSGFPTFSITAVTRNQTVSVVTSNLPANDRFDVLMGPIGTRGINGYYVTTVDTGAGGRMNFTFNVPAQLKGARQIAIRMQSRTGSGYFAFNWFWNNSTQ